MNMKNPEDMAKEFLARVKAGDPDKVADLFTDNLEFEVAGDVGALPWIGKKTGKSAISAMLRDMGQLIERIRMEFGEPMANDHQAVIVGYLETRVKSTGKVIKTTCAFILSMSGDKIGRFQMLEDSFAVSVAARMA
jgi:ketosteroid isomerase-like protein